MRAMNYTASDPGFITLCIQLAQSTFSDVMPPKPEAGTGARPAKAVASRRSSTKAGFPASTTGSTASK